MKALFLISIFALNFSGLAHAEKAPLNFTASSYENIEKCKADYDVGSELRSRCLMEVAMEAQTREMSTEERLEFRMCMEERSFVEMSKGRLSDFLRASHDCRRLAP